MHSFDLLYLVGECLVVVVVVFAMEIMLCHFLRRENDHIPPPDDEQEFQLDITIFREPPRNGAKVVALLDTQCQKGNWISSRLIRKLGLSSQVVTKFTPIEVSCANGYPVRACGVISLDWKCYPNGNRCHQSRFYVLPRAVGFDVILGADFIRKEKLFTVNRHVICPLVRNARPNRVVTQAAIEEQKRRQEKEKADLEARRSTPRESSDSGGREEASAS